MRAGTHAVTFALHGSLVQLQQEIQELSASEKEALLRFIWEELDGPEDANVDAAWLEEVKRRSREIDDGSVALIPADEVFARIEASLKR